MKDNNIDIIFPDYAGNIEKLKAVSASVVKALADLEAGKITLNQSKVIASLANHAIRSIAAHVLLEQQLIRGNILLPEKEEEE